MSIQKQSAAQAITPSGMDFIRKIRTDEKLAGVDIVEATDRKVAALSDMDGWKILRSRIQEEIDRIRNLRDVDNIYMMDEGEIGKRFLIASLLAEKLEWVLTMVEAPAKFYADKESTGE